MSDHSAIEKLLAYYGLGADTIHFVEGDINDPISLQVAIEGCSACYHCAALVSFDNSKLSELIHVNTRGTENVVNAALRNGVKLCHVSTTAAIGETLVDGQRTEQSTWVSDKGKSAYSISKHYAELEVFRGVEEGLEALILNPGIIIGPGVWGKSSTTLFMRGVKGMKFYPSGGNGFVDVRDVSEIALELMAREKLPEGQHLLVGENMLMKDLFVALASVGTGALPKYLVPDWLVRFGANVIGKLDWLGLNPTAFSAQSLRAAMSKQTFSNTKAIGLGCQFRTISSAISYTSQVYQS
jgi:dihydroflavonol-4-reductase